EGGGESLRPVGGEEHAELGLDAVADAPGQFAERQLAGTGPAQVTGRGGQDGADALGGGRRPDGVGQCLKPVDPGAVEDTAVVHDQTPHGASSATSMLAPAAVSRGTSR